jgi:CheY-like chemotaxis protein
LSRKILVVDDEPDILLATRLLLESASFSVVEARNGEEALAAVDVEKPDAMLLDLRMPGMDGWEVLEHLREKGQLGRLPVIVLSAHTGGTTMERSFELGAKGYVSKPFELADLRKALEQVLGDL